MSILCLKFSRYTAANACLPILDTLSSNGLPIQQVIAVSFVFCLDTRRYTHGSLIVLGRCGDGNGSWVKWVTIFGWVTWVTGHCQ